MAKNSWQLSVIDGIWNGSVSLMRVNKMKMHCLWGELCASVSHSLCVCMYVCCYSHHSIGKTERKNIGKWKKCQNQCPLLISPNQDHLHISHSFIFISHMCYRYSTSAVSLLSQNTIFCDLMSFDFSRELKPRAGLLFAFEHPFGRSPVDSFVSQWANYLTLQKMCFFLLQLNRFFLFMQRVLRKRVTRRGQTFN